MALRSFIYTLLNCLKCDYRTVAHNIKAAIALDLTGQTVQGISALTSWQSSVTGKLNGDEFLSLWKKVTTFKVKNKKHVACDSEFLPDFIYIFFKILHCTNGNYLLLIQDIFCRTDVDKSGTLSLTELRNALMATGRRKYQSVKRDTTFHLPGSQQPNLLLYCLFALKLLFLYSILPFEDKNSMQMNS